MNSLPLISEDSEDPIVKRVFDRLKSRWGGVLNLYRLLGWSPNLLNSWSSFAWSVRYELGVDRKLCELVIVRIAILTKATYEYEHHLRIAQREGVTPDQIAALTDWQASDLFDNRECAALHLADDLALGFGASETTMARLQQVFSNSECVELLVTGSFYCGVARIINSAGVAVEAHHSSLMPSNE